MLGNTTSITVTDALSPATFRLWPASRRTPTKAGSDVSLGYWTLGAFFEVGRFWPFSPLFKWAAKKGQKRPKAAKWLSSVCDLAVLLGGEGGRRPHEGSLLPITKIGKEKVKFWILYQQLTTNDLAAGKESGKGGKGTGKASLGGWAGKLKAEISKGQGAWSLERRKVCPPSLKLRRGAGARRRTRKRPNFGCAAAQPYQIGKSEVGIDEEKEKRPDTTPAFLNTKCTAANAITITWPAALACHQ